jgi:glutamate racemase
MTEKKCLPIGIFDSGMGGLSILKELIKIMPFENYIYYGDNYNFPYGNYNAEKIVELCEKGINYLFSKCIKLLVIACNTVTAAAVNRIRSTSDIPVIGMEPAVLPASRRFEGGKILLLATKATLKYRDYSNFGLTCVPCEGLASLIENNFDNDALIEENIRNILKPYGNGNYLCIVLGCTHYVLKKYIFQKVSGCEVIDGNEGTAKNTFRTLEKADMLCQCNNKPYIKLILTDGKREKYDTYKKIISRIK